MAGTSEGAKKAVATRKAREGKDVYARIGTMGGEARNKSPKKFVPFKDKEFARKMAKKASKARWAKSQDD